jgi:hypothetical protein
LIYAVIFFAIFYSNLGANAFLLPLDTKIPALFRQRSNKNYYSVK